MKKYVIAWEALITGSSIVEGQDEDDATDRLLDGGAERLFSDACDEEVDVLDISEFERDPEEDNGPDEVVDDFEGYGNPRRITGKKISH